MPVWGWRSRKKMDPDHEKRWKSFLRLMALETLPKPGPRSFPAACASGRPLIRTLALEPDLLLLDEPFSALDYQTRLTVCDDISTIIRSRKKTAVLITHDLSGSCERSGPDPYPDPPPRPYQRYHFYYVSQKKRIVH